MWTTARKVLNSFILLFAAFQLNRCGTLFIFYYFVLSSPLFSPIIFLFSTHAWQLIINEIFSLILFPFIFIFPTSALAYLVFLVTL